VLGKKRQGLEAADIKNGGAIPSEDRSKVVVEALRGPSIRSCPRQQSVETELSRIAPFSVVTDVDIVR
jgi:hypothetical protein